MNLVLTRALAVGLAATTSVAMAQVSHRPITTSGAAPPLLLPAQVVGFIGDSRANNIRGWFDVLAGEGFACANPVGSSATYELPLAPLPAIPGLQAFWNFTDTASLWQEPWSGGHHPASNGDPVGLVEDSSGNGRDLVVRGNESETLTTSSVNNLPTVAGDGISTLGFDVSGSPLTMSADFTVAEVVRTRGDNKGLLSSQSPSQSLQIIGGYLHILDGVQDSQSDRSTSTGDAFHLLIWQREGTIVRFFRDGEQLGGDQSVSAEPTLSFAQADNFLDDPSAISPTDKAAALVYDRALSTQELGRLKVYVNSRFQLYTSDAANMSTKPSSATADWLPDASSWVTEGVSFVGDPADNPFNTTVAQFKDTGVDVVYVDLGVNDYINDVPLTTFSANLTAIVDGLVANGFKVIVDIPYRTKNIDASVTDGYRDAIEALGASQDPAKVVICTRMEYDWGNSNIADPAYSDDGVHMNYSGIPLEENKKQYEIERGLRLLLPLIFPHP